VEPTTLAAIDSPGTSSSVGLAVDPHAVGEAPIDFETVVDGLESRLAGQTSELVRMRNRVRAGKPCSTCTPPAPASARLPALRARSLRWRRP